MLNEAIFFVCLSFLIVVFVSGWANDRQARQVAKQRQIALDIWASEKEAEGLDPWAGGSK